MFKDILLTIDLETEESWKKTVPEAVQYAQMSGATLHVMTVVPNFGMSIVGSFFPKGYEKEVLEKANEHLHAFVKEHIPEDIRIQHVVGHGNVYEEILRVQRELGCDMIILGAHRPTMQDYLLGPNAARVVRHAQCSVLVVRD